MLINEQIDALIAANQIIMDARAKVLRLAPVHDYLCRVARHIDDNARALMLDAIGR